MTSGAACARADTIQVLRAPAQARTCPRGSTTRSAVSTAGMIRARLFGACEVFTIETLRLNIRTRSPSRKARAAELAANDSTKWLHGLPAPGVPGARYSHARAFAGKKIR